MFAATRKCADQATKNLEREERQLRVIYFHWRDYRDPRDIPTRALSAHCIANRRHARSTDPAIHDARFQLLLFARKFIQNPFEGFLSLETLPAVIGSGLEWSGAESNRNRAVERSPAHRANVRAHLSHLSLVFRDGTIRSALHRGRRSLGSTILERPRRLSFLPRRDRWHD